MSAPCRIRVLLLGFRPLTRRFVADAVRAAPDMELMGEPGRATPVDSSLPQPDVIVVQAAADGMELQTSPSRVLEVFGGGCDVYERRLVRANIGLEELLDVIRETAVGSGGRREE